VNFDPIGFEASNLIVDQLFSNAAAVGEGGHAGDGGGEFAEVAAPFGSLGRSTRSRKRSDAAARTARPEGIKAELALREASRMLLSQHTSLYSSSEIRRYADTATVVRKELDKLVDILADDASEKHWNVAPRVAKCADYLAQIPSREVQGARLDMIAAYRVLQDVEEITL